CRPRRNQPPMHEPAFVAAFVADNDGNRRGSLFRGDVKAGVVPWQIAVKIPANPDVTELDRGCDAATHIDSNLYTLWFSRKTGENQHTPGGPCRSSSCVQVGPRLLALRTRRRQVNSFLPTLFRSA